MQLKLKLQGKAEPFFGYLKGFEKIKTSLLLEIDVKNQQFIAKTYTEGKDAVRFAAIDFETANVSVEKFDSEDLDVDRIKFGIIGRLGKIISMCECCYNNGAGEFTMTFMFSQTKDDKTGNIDYVVTSFTAASSAITLKQDSFRISEFEYMDDETFDNKVYKVVNPVTFKLTSAMIKSVIDTSEIVKLDPRKDLISFYTKDKKVYACDVPMLTDSNNFVMEVADMDNDPIDPATVTIVRQKFIQILGKTNEDFIVRMGKGPGGDNRILFESTVTKTRIVIAAIKKAK